MRGYTQINFIYKGMSNFQKNICDVTHHKSYGWEIIDATEVHKRIVYIYLFINV